MPESPEKWSDFFMGGPLAANTLHLLRRFRNSADYDLKCAFSLSKAKLSVNYAKKS